MVKKRMIKLKMGDESLIALQGQDATQQQFFSVIRKLNLPLVWTTSQQLCVWRQCKAKVKFERKWVGNRARVDPYLFGLYKQKTDFFFCCLRSRNFSMSMRLSHKKKSSLIKDTPLPDNLITMIMMMSLMRNSRIFVLMLFAVVKEVFGKQS